MEDLREMEAVAQAQAIASQLSNGPNPASQFGGKLGYDSLYTITDDMSSSNAQRSKIANTLLPMPATVTYSAGFRDIVDGLLVSSHAPFGVRSRSVWAVKQDEEGGWLLQETATATANWFLMSFIKKTISDAHEKLVRDFVTELEEGEEGTDFVREGEGVDAVGQRDLVERLEGMAWD